MDNLGNMTRKEACYFLGIRENASEEQIKRAYRYKAKLYHPDVNPDTDAKEYYIKVQKAYEYLINHPYTAPQNTINAANMAGPEANNSSTKANGQAGTGMNMGENSYMNHPYGSMKGNSFYGTQAVPRPVKVYASTAKAKANYQKQKEKEKEHIKIQKWDEEYKNSKRHQQQTQCYGKEYADRATGTSRTEEEKILEKIRAIWLAEIIKRQIAEDREHKEAIQRRKLYKAFMQQELQEEDSVKKMSRPARDAD